MKKLYPVFVLLAMLSLQLNAQIFYNIEMPPSYRNTEISDVANLHSINYDVDSQGNLIKNNVSLNIRNYLTIEKIGEKNIGRVKFSITAKSLGEITLRFSEVKLNNGANCFVYTSDYDIVAGPIYENSISNTLNIVKIPAYELILEIIFVDANDFDLTLNSISYQSLIDVTKKNNNSLQGAISPTDWNCDSCEYGEIKFVDNFDNFANNDTNYTSYGGSLLGMGTLNDNRLDSFELFYHPNLYSVNDLKLDAARAACVVMPPTPDGSYTQSLPGTLINFPGMNCKGIVISAYHVWQVANICDYQKQLNPEWSLNHDTLSYEDSIEYTNYLNNTIIRFNWHHKYGKPLHLKYKCAPTNANFKLWRKTIDFDEVIDYCGATGFAYSDGQDGDYAIIKMKQMPFYKELHLGWTTEAYCDTTPGKFLSHPERFMVLGRHGATPTYIFKNNTGKLFWTGAYHKAMAIDLDLMYSSEPSLDTRGYSGSQLIYQPDYPNPDANLNPWIGIGMMKSFANDFYDTRCRIYSYSFGTYQHYPNPSVYTYIVDPDLPLNKRGYDTNLYTGYLREHKNKMILHDDFYYMPSVENREKCPSTLGGGTDPCTFVLNSKIDVVYPKDGTMLITIRIGEISSDDFQGNQRPKGVRIYNSLGDQQTFYFDTFADSINIPSTIQFTISQCDIFYYQMMGLTSITFGIDYYDITGKILNANGCNMKYSYPLPNTLCEALSITSKRNEGNPLDSCCSYTIRIKFKGCDDYSNIVRIMLDTLSLKNLIDNTVVPIESLSNINANYELGEISFTIGGICTPTSYKLLAPFGDTKNCESFSFNLDCIIPDPPCDCCSLFRTEMKNVWKLPENLNIPPLMIESHKFWFHFTGVGDCGWSGFGNPDYYNYCTTCQFISAHIYAPNPNPLEPAPIYDETFISNKLGYSGNGFGTLQGLPSGTYCFYIEILTNQGICRDTVCVAYDGTYWTLTQSPPAPIIYLDESNNLLPITTKLEYEKVILVDINGKVLIESKFIDKIDISTLPKGTYNILYRKNDKIIQSQKLIIK